MTLYDFALTVDYWTLVPALLGLIVIGIGYLIMPLLYLIERFPGEGETFAQPVALMPDEALPEILVQLPVFNEPHVVSGLLDAVAALDWPKDKLCVQLLDDSTDHHALTVAAAKIAQLQLLGVRIDHLRRSHRSGFKAEALAAGLRDSQAPFVAVLDADFRPPANWLRIVVPHLMASPQAAFVQSRCEFENAATSWLTRAQGLLFDSHFVMEQALRARWGMLVQFNGTAAVWRRSAIDGAGGWSGDSLCEDLDLTVRAALAGWRGIVSMEPVVPGLVPNRVEHWRVQQQRWAMGFAQIARKLLAVIWTSDWAWSAKFSAAFLILYQAVFPLAVIAVISLLANLLLGGLTLPYVLPLVAIVLLLVVIVALAMTWPPYRALRRGSTARYLSTVVTLPPLVVYLALCNAQPMLAAFLGRKDIFRRTPKGEAVPL